ncbi:P-loop containing nucleoside triphosphate hydrolase protein [Phycomyces nitens]|nr:P-loop containing nucleoside triphosphate hydrolase protein [Phycomyces nitens]
MRKLSDLRFPNEWFPEARQMQRKIFLHVGPTNSGKTYNALKRLEGAESGIYCGPLRLLANEIFEKMNDKGVACNLLTGEERRIVSPTATLTSSTVEMANLVKPIEVAVIDEIQMIGDSQRGWAWTQALLGLKAQEIHLCGEASVIPLVKEICASLNEEVVVNEYKRLTPVTILDKTVDPEYKEVKAGDCVIAFSRKDIFNIKEKIQKSTGLKCAVVYGALPPETRALQAKSFNDPESDINVMVASDAVGMGLNLNIKRVVFSTVHKFDGKNMVNVSIPQMKQIGGRAGRFGTTYASGEVTAIASKDLKYVKDCMGSGTINLKLAGLQPTVDILEMFALQMPNERFSGLLQKFEDLASLSGNYFLCNFEDQKVISDTIERVKLPLRDRYQFVTAPVNVRNPESLEAIGDLARIYSNSETRSLEDFASLPDIAPSSEKGLIDLETKHKSIMLYMWLRYDSILLIIGSEHGHVDLIAYFFPPFSIRYPDTFITDQEKCAEIKKRCEEMIDDALKNSVVKMSKKGSYISKTHPGSLKKYGSPKGPRKSHVYREKS